MGFSTTKQDGVTYVERDYKCHDCDWTWTQVCIKGDSSDLPECPNCHNTERKRFHKPSRDEEIKSNTAKKGRPKSKDIDWSKPKINISSGRGKRIAQAAELAYAEAQKQGFSDMQDSGVREGDVCAPKLHSLVATVQDNVFRGGWTGGQAPAHGGAVATDAGGRQAMGMLQDGISKGSVRDNLGGVGNIKK